MKKIFIIVLLILTSCGYEPLYKINQNSEKLSLTKTFNTGTPVESVDFVGFYRVDEHFPPEETRAPDPVGTVLQLMFYIVELFLL